MLRIAKANILSMSPSSFSYLAAMLSDGVKIARYPWWHLFPDTDDLIRLNENQFPSKAQLNKAYKK